jgi:hypothetical protein
LAEKEAFELRYIPRLTSVGRIFEKVESVDKQRDFPFKCSVVHME